MFTRSPEFLLKVARLVAQPASTAPPGVQHSILTVAAGSYGFRPACDEVTMPSGFDPLAASLFESIVEASYLVVCADGVCDEPDKNAFQTIVFEACRRAVSRDALDVLMADLSDQLREDGIEKRIEVVAQTVNRTNHQREVLRIAAFLGQVSHGIGEVERKVLVKMTKAFLLEEMETSVVLAEVKRELVEAQGI